MRAPTLLETFLAAAFGAAVFALVLPDFARARAAYSVELAARAAADCDAELVRIARAARAAARSGAGPVPEAEPTLAAIAESRAGRGAPPLVWPREADLSTVDFSSTNGVSVLLRLRGGGRRVDARDLEVDHVN